MVKNGENQTVIEQIVVIKQQERNTGYSFFFNFKKIFLCDGECW